MVGVLARTAWDTAVLLQGISGHDAEDITTVESEGTDDFVGALTPPFPPARIGVIRGYFQDSIDPAVEENLSGFVSRLEQLGCSARSVAPDWLSEAYDRWVPIRRAEATAFHMKWLQTTPQLYGRDVFQLLEQGKDVLAVDYVAAVNARPSFMERFADTMRDYDFLVIPTTTILPPRLEESEVRVKGRSVPAYSALNRLPIPFNYIGCPVLSVPSGQVDGLPLGVQVAGRLFDESSLLRLARAYEEMFGPYPRPPLGE